MKNLEDYQKDVVAFRDERNWKQFHTPKDFAIALTLESAEVAEHFLWKSPGEIETYVKEHKDDIAEELGDVLYCIMLMSHDLDIDILESATKKMAKNREKYPIEKSKGRNVKHTQL